LVIDSWARLSQPLKAAVLAIVSTIIGDLHAAPGHGGKEFRQKVQAGHVVSALEAAKDFRR
jgi:hypothetical protein